MAAAQADRRKHTRPRPCGSDGEEGHPDHGWNHHSGFAAGFRTADMRPQQHLYPAARPDDGLVRRNRLHRRLYQGVQAQQGRAFGEGKTRAPVRPRSHSGPDRMHQQRHSHRPAGDHHPLREGPRVRLFLAFPFQRAAWGVLLLGHLHDNDHRGDPRLLQRSEPHRRP